MRVGQARRRDAVEGEILKAWRQIGVLAWPISGEGIPDALTYHLRTKLWLPVEIKSPGGGLTVAQIETYAKAPFPIVESISEALQLFGVKA